MPPEIIGLLSDYLEVLIAIPTLIACEEYLSRGNSMPAIYPREHAVSAEAGSGRENERNKAIIPGIVLFSSMLK